MTTGKPCPIQFPVRLVGPAETDGTDIFDANNQNIPFGQVVAALNNTASFLSEIERGEDAVTDQQLAALREKHPQNHVAAESVADALDDKPERLHDPREDKSPPTQERLPWIVSMMWDLGLYTQAREVQRLGDAYYARSAGGNIQSGPLCLPVKLYHRNVPVGDTGDYDGVTEIRDDEGTVICDWWNADEDDEARAVEMVRLLNLQCAASHVGYIDRGDAVNLARNALDDEHWMGRVSRDGVRVLCEAVMKMDEAIRRAGSATPLSGWREVASVNHRQVAWIDAQARYVATYLMGPRYFLLELPAIDSPERTVRNP